MIKQERPNLTMFERWAVEDERERTNQERERAEHERERAERQRERAEKAEAELAVVRERLRQLENRGR